MVLKNGDLEKRLRASAEELRANSDLKVSEYSTQVPGLISCVMQIINSPVRNKQ